MMVGGWKKGPGYAWREARARGEQVGVARNIWECGDWVHPITKRVQIEVRDLNGDSGDTIDEPNGVAYPELVLDSGPRELARIPLGPILYGEGRHDLKANPIKLPSRRLMLIEAGNRGRRLAMSILAAMHMTANPAQFGERFDPETELRRIAMHGVPQLCEALARLSERSLAAMIEGETIAEEDAATVRRGIAGLRESGKRFPRNDAADPWMEVCTPVSRVGHDWVQVLAADEWMSPNVRQGKFIVSLSFFNQTAGHDQVQAILGDYMTELGERP